MQYWGDVREICYFDAIIEKAQQNGPHHMRFCIYAHWGSVNHMNVPNDNKTLNDAFSRRTNSFTNPEPKGPLLSHILSVAEQVWLAIFTMLLSIMWNSILRRKIYERDEKSRRNNAYCGPHHLIRCVHLLQCRNWNYRRSYQTKHLVNGFYRI